MSTTTTRIALLVLALCATTASAAAQEPDSDDFLNYPWTFSADGSLDFSSVDGQQTQVLAIPVSIWLRRLTGDRRMGIRLRLTGILGFADFERIEELDLDSVRLGGVFPGIELLFPLGARSMLRPYLDLGVGLTDTRISNILVGDVGLRTEFVFPWKRWELGLEPRLLAGVASRSGETLDTEFIELAGKADARYPLGFTIDGQHPDVGAYVEAGWFPDGLDFVSQGGSRLTVDQTYEIGLTLGFRFLAPKIWFVRVPRLGIGYRFGDGLSGLRIRIGGDRVTRLPLP